MVERTPYTRYEAERQPSPDHQISQHINEYLWRYSSLPMVGVNQATTMAEPAVPHCNTMARNEVIAILENEFGPQRLRVARAWRGLQFSSN